MDGLIFCQHPFEKLQPDDPYIQEGQAAKALDMPWGLLDYDALIKDRDPQYAIRNLRLQPGEYLYRGWMMRPAEYAILYQTLLQREIKLINDAQQYQHAHYFPESYTVIANITPMSVWTTNLKADYATLLAPFGDKPIILKDFVKSRKYEWEEACYIKQASDIDRVLKTVKKFLELQGPDFNEGLVFREFVDFEKVGYYPKTKLPIFHEYRIFFLTGQPVFICRYWDGCEYTGSPPISDFLEIAAKINNNFFTMDVAKTTDGRWLIVEIGDGQVSGLPEHVNREEFIQALRGKLQ